MLAGAGLAIPPEALSVRIEALRGGAGTLLLALDWGPPSGAIALHWFATLDRARPTAQIDFLLVNEADRRRGIGRLLVKAAAQAARVAGCGTLDFAAGGSAALREFCVASGFTMVGERYARNVRKAAGA